MHSPDKDWEEPADDDDEPRQSKRPRHSKGDSASRSSLAKRVVDLEVADMGSSSPSAKESFDPHDPLNVDPLNSVPPLAFGRLPSVFLGRKTKN